MEHASPLRGTRLIHWALTLGIVIILNLLFNVGLELFVKEPQHADFCTERQVRPAVPNQEACLAVGGQWSENVQGKYPPAPQAVTPEPVPAGYCNEYFTCQKEYDAARREYNRNAFITLIIAGVIAILAGMFITVSAPVSLGLSWGGVLSLIIGSVRYWSDMNTEVRFIILLVAFAALIWIGIKKIQE